MESKNHIGTTDDTEEQNRSVMSQRQDITGEKCTAAWEQYDWV